MSFQVNTTSSAVSGWPSLQRKLRRSLNVQVFWSDSTDHDSARLGTAFWLGQSSEVNPLKSMRNTSVEEDSFATMGLNVFGSPIVATTSRPRATPGSQSATSGGSAI